MLNDIPAEEVRRACEACVAEILAEAGENEPSVNAIRVARRLGVTVLAGGRDGPRAQLVALGGTNKTIVLGEESRPERRQWAVAHELGEAHAERVFCWLGMSAQDQQGPVREWIANRLASVLLLPGNWLWADAERCGWDLLELKSVYCTASHELIAVRLLELGKPAVVSVFDQGRLTWRRSSVGRRTPELAPGELEAWSTVHTGGGFSRAESRQLPPGVSAVRCWPVHEPGWRREIMLTEIDD